MIHRAMTPTDRRYVVPTWAQSASYEGLAKPKRFELVDRILDAGATCIVLANDRTVHAWACGSDGVLHYAYVPPELRGKGLARRLISLVLGSYPERIPITHSWPFASTRYVHTALTLPRAA